MFDEGSNGSRVRRLMRAVLPVSISDPPPPPPPRLSASEHPRRPGMMRASSFLQRSPLLLLAAMLVALGVFLAHDTPPAARAQASTNASLASLTASGSAGGAFTAFDLTTNAVWSATLTAKQLILAGSNQGFGCGNYTSGAECSSSSVLTEDEFSLGGKDYTIIRILDNDLGGSDYLAVSITPSSGAPGDDLKALNFCVGTRAFALSGLSSGGTANLGNTDVGWSVGDTVQLSIGATCDPTEYAATVANSVTHAKLTPTVDDTGKATVQVGPQGGTLNTVTDGQPSAALALNVGDNPFTVRVTAEDATTKDYTVTITRQAPGPVALVSNHGQTQGDYHSTTGFVNAQAFTTGSHTAGYTLSAVEAVVEYAPNDAQRATIRAELWTVASGGAPEARVVDLAVPSSISVGTVSFAAPANTVLQSGRSYFFLLYTTGDFDPRIDHVTTGDEDSGAATGWSIADDRYFKRSQQPGGSASWESASSNPLRITVKGNEGAPPTIWTATLTAQHHTQFNADGCFSLTQCNSQLTDNDFSAGGQAYSFQNLRDMQSTGVFFVTFSAVPDAGLRAHNLCVGPRSFSLSAFGDDATTHSYQFINLPWSTNDEIRLSIGTACHPGAPTGLGATAGASSLALAWTAPTVTGGSAINGYDVHYTSSTAVDDDAEPSGNDPSAAWVAISRSGTTASQSITGLTDGTTYKVRVRAKNGAGAGPSGWVRTTGTPETPTGSDNANLASLTASGGASAGGAFTAFDLTGPTLSTAPVWSATLTAKQLILAGSNQGFGCGNYTSGAECSSTSVLTEDEFSLGGKDYTFLRILDNDLGGSDYLAVTIRPSSGAPGDDLKALNFCVGTRAFALTELEDAGGTANLADTDVGWAVGDTVQLSIGASCDLTDYAATVPNSVTHAKLTPTVDDTGKATVQVGPQGGTLNTVTDGQPSAALALSVGDNAFTVRVTAENATTKDHTVTITREAQGTHAAPTGLTVTASNRELGLSWTAPATGTVTGYDVHYTSSTTVGNDAPATGGGSAAGWYDTSFTGTSTTDTLRGLTNGETYRVRVRANYAGGDSAWVHRSGTPTGGTQPPAPGTPTVRLSASPNPVDEGSSVTITATLSAAQTSALTIPVTITDDTAESGDHGTLASIAIDANAASGTGTITTAQDTDADHETFDVALGTPLPTGIAAGSPSSVRITISDDEASTGPAFWTGTLTTGHLSNGLLGCQTPNMNLAGNQGLTHTLCSERIAGGNTFSHDGDTYRILGVHRTPPGRHDDGHQRFGLIVNRALPEDWVLVVDGGIWLSMRDTQWSYGTGPAPNASGRPHTWKGTNVSWTQDGTATLSLIKPEASTPTVALSASPETVLEGDTVTVTATLSAAASSAVTLRLRGELSSITIPPGQTEGTATFTAAEDTDHTGVSQWTEAQFDEVVRVAINAGLPPGVLTEPTAPRIGASSKQLVISVIDDDAPLPRVSLFAGPGNVINEGEEGYVGVTMSRGVHGDVSIPLSYTPGTAEPADYSGPLSLTITRPPTDANRGVITIPEDGDSGAAEEWEDFTVSINAGALPNWLTAGSFQGNGGWGTSYEFTIHDTTPASGQQAGGQNDPPCDNCGTGGDTGAVAQGQGKYADLIAQMKEWRNDPDWSHQKAHTDRWDRALLAFGETVDDATLTPMTAAEAQALADQDWGVRWVPVAAALWELENQSPTVSNALADVTIVNESGTEEVSLSGVFDDADGDSLTITAASSDEATATASVESDGSSLTVTARLRGTATITVTADDGKGGTVEDSFTVTVKASPLVAQPLDDVSGLEMETTQEVSLVGVFSDADGDALTITASSGDEAIATAALASDGSNLTLTGVVEGTVTVTVTAQDSDGNSVSDAFQVEVVQRFASLIPQMYEWRNDPQWSHRKSHTDRWDRALLALGETVADTTLTPMTAAEAQALADQSWGVRWVPVAAALWQIEGGRQQETPNAVPTVSAAISDATIVNETGTQTVSLSGVFDDADNDSLTITASSGDEAVATVSVAADYASLTVTAQARGTATITVTASDGNGGTVEDAFTVTVKAAPGVASDIADVTGLEAGSTQEVSLSGVFTDADGDALSVTASSGDEAVATVTVAADHSALTVAGVGEGTVTVTVIAQDSDGNLVMDDFAVTVVAQQQQQPSQPANEAPTVSASIADATIVSESGTKQVSLSGVFSDADNDSLTVSAASSDEAKATVSVAGDYSGLTVNAQARGTATITVTANDGRGGTVSDTFTVTVKAVPVVASAIADMDLKAGATQNEGGVRDVTLSAVFSDADGDSLTFTADTSDFAIAEALLFQGILTVVGLADGSATITVTAQDADGNTVSDTFNVSVVGPPTSVSGLSCVAQTDRVLFSWDAPQWSGAELYAYDYDLTLPDGRREQSRLQGYPAVSGRGEYQAGQQASISVKAVYELADGSEVSSAEATLSCTVAE